MSTESYPGFAGMEVISKETVKVSGSLAVPGVCTFTQDGDGPFLDTKTVIHSSPYDTHILASVAKVRDMGRAIGMVPQEDVDSIIERVIALEAELTDANRKLEALEVLA